MISMIKNPFDINKAVDYTDEDIFKYWVDINDQAGFNEMLKYLDCSTNIYYNKH